ncbi:porphobilinogen synthase [Magnetococcus marinus MC-1]|uniref:Delta-aminolevulinic acid dehydratase n=1 Tax=Magnetococcus marinus (strain ATCC BAA-1437 / JCM 17883 / MC-1) TaxID=156889 RepID=A0LCE1_MAGMM|nr:porphobilinogen synthase [Magnetococcus marinus]ABK45634.1 porphobilinogen synthase [Magnetococcus marinus MC-1]
MADLPFRPRRLRTTPAIRAMVRENHLRAVDLIYPIFIVPGQQIRKPVVSMPGVSQLSIDQAIEVCQHAYDLGVGGVILFGIPDHKDAAGSESFAEQGILQQAIHAIKAAVPDLYLIADVCMCEYTDHAHCGILVDGQVDNDRTLSVLQRIAVSYADAGIDMVAPSGMMDGMVRHIRLGLDAKGYTQIPIMSYAIKYASAFYGPFRDAAENTPSSGDRRGYQMDPANRREAIKEAEQDILEGADILMVKPGLPYLDIVRDLRNHTNRPTAVYNVSGEYAMIKAAAMNGWIDEQGTVLEMLLGFKRAGADMILTYHALDAARWLQG